MSELGPAFLVVASQRLWHGIRTTHVRAALRARVVPLAYLKAYLGVLFQKIEYGDAAN